MLRLFKRRRPAHRAGVMTGREAVAYALAYEACKGSRLDMLEYENDPLTRAAWLAAADRRITDRADIDIAYAWGLDLAQWNSLTDWERSECRRNITVAPRFQP